MNLSRLHQRSKLKISERKIKLRAEEGNRHGSLFKLLLGQQCWGYLDLWDLHEWHFPILCSGQCQRPDPSLMANAIGLLVFVQGEIFAHYAAVGSIVTRCNHFLKAFKSLESYGCSAEMDHILPEARQVWHKQVRWSKWWISSICYSPSSCVELFLVVWTACFTRARVKTAKPIFRCRQ